MGIQQHWNYQIVLLSLAIAFFGAYGGISIFELYKSNLYLPAKKKILSNEGMMVLIAVSFGGIFKF
jgi:hypothetical protein